MTSQKRDVTQRGAQSAQPTAAGSEEAVQLVLEGLRSMDKRYRTASKEQQVLIQATHVQWASMAGSPPPAPYSTVQVVEQHTYSTRQESVQSGLSGLESHVSTLQIAAPRSFHELTGISDVRDLLTGQHTAPVASVTTFASTFTPLAAGTTVSDAVQKGIESFFRCSGRLFHVFTEEQIADYQNARLFGTTEESRNYATCVASAVAAVGLQYLPDDAYASAKQSLYAIARQHYDFLLEFNPLEAMKVCALFVLYNVFARATVALAYIEVGLSLCHQFGIDKPAISYQGEHDQWTEYRRTWRTLLFFSGWLASSLGYVSGDDTLVRAIPNFNWKIPPISLKVSQPVPQPLSLTHLTILEVAQNELVKISLLKLRIIRMQEAFGEHSVLSVASTRSDLDSWYNDLPQVMSLDRLSQNDLPAYARKMIYNVHLLYLCASILLYRRVASHIVRLSRAAQSIPLQQQQEELLKYIAEGRDAARDSATLLSIFYAEGAFCKRCWLAIYQAYTTCLVLLFSAVQSYVDGVPVDSRHADLEKARQCLEILEWCGSLDHVARQFHQTLSPCYEALITAGMTTPTQENPRGDSPFYPGATFTTTATSPNSDCITKYFSIPHMGDLNFHRHAYKLLDLLCRPFADSQPLSPNERADCNLANQPWHDPSGVDFAVVPERMEWNPGSRNLFQWDLAKIGIPAAPSQWPDVSSGGAFLVHAAESVASSNHFVGSMRPSGWETVPSLMRLC
ncbi:hypothetical protein PG993_005511 [Apiospora rasikravindrae]|uniref:Transcription factor domain-containing protein n=1 Tax=Apiospora rasikravindrae TaxID=990691 RepID=A0ABR1TGG6_9PEZI